MDKKNRPVRGGSTQGHASFDDLPDVNLRHLAGDSRDGGSHPHVVIDAQQPAAILGEGVRGNR